MKYNGDISDEIVNRFYGKSYPLVNNTLQIAKETNFRLREKLFLRFSSFGKGLEKTKTEPVLIFEK